MRRAKPEDPIAHLCARAVELGALEAKLISPETVVTAMWVRLKCQYGCGGYGRRLTCPPYSPTPAQTRELLDGYERAILIHGSNHTDMHEVVADLEREAFLAGFYKAFGLASGPCGLCDECNLEFCEHPHRARPAMEACGIDVYATARGNSYPIEVLTKRGCQGNYYGLVLVE